MKEEVDSEKIILLKEMFPLATIKELYTFTHQILTRPLKGFPKTWKYDILGNKDADILFSQYIRILKMHYSDEEWDAYQEELENISGYIERMKVSHKHDLIVLEKCFANLLRYVESMQSRLAFQVLGVFLMKLGTKISDDLKSLILENSRWEDDLPYLEDAKNQEERKRHLDDFRQKLQNYHQEFDPDYGFIKILPGIVLPAIYHLKYKSKDYPALLKKEKERRARVIANIMRAPLDLDQFIINIKKILENPTSDKGILDYKGYIFIFRDWSEVPDELHQSWSHKVCELGEASFESYFEAKYNVSLSDKKTRLNYFDQYLFENNDFNLKLMGALKTLAPKLEFGGLDIFFDMWMFVQTPEGSRFPANIYYGSTGLSIGAWSSYFDDNGNFYFPHKFMDLIKGNPHEFNHEQQAFFLESLEEALSKVSISDFEGKFRYDGGCSIWGIKKGRPYSKHC